MSTAECKECKSHIGRLAYDFWNDKRKLCKNCLIDLIYQMDEDFRQYQENIQGDDY